MKLVSKKITLSELKQTAISRFGNMVKAVVDVQEQIMLVDAEMHADEEQALIKRGSRQQDLWGINLYPEHFSTADFIEFDSMINLRPAQGNLSRSVEDKTMQNQIRQIVAKLVAL